ncbi:uncharacterized protein LOC132737516 [Ruditapes philippinarum]|uniref:uncharacterized protein LOC132737516 n=1 Tax=Ruditapes philippinarum TaxID=129788 RepID=UPI00295AE20C|nr:uncharacterized protein LOC132737516 [Ruditapes philippinarum]
MFWSFSTACKASFLVLLLTTHTGSNMDIRARWSACIQQDDPFLVFFHISVKNCAAECAKRSECDLMGYKRRINVCELYWKNYTEKLGKYTENSCIFIRREKLAYIKDLTICTCNSGETCDYKAGQCILTECSLLTLKNGKLYGNLRTINSKKRIRCDKGYIESNGVVETTCQPNGAWSYTPTCVKQKNAECPKSTGEWIYPSLHSDFKIMFSHLSVDEATAKVDCGAHNLSRIVKIDVDWKHMFIANVLANCTGFVGSCYWIEGSSITGTWQYMDLTPVTLNKFWDAGEPIIANGQCMAINKNQRWQAQNCNHVCHYICEQQGIYS